MYRQTLIAVVVVASPLFAQVAQAKYAALALSPSTGNSSEAWNADSQDAAEQAALSSLSDQDKRVTIWCTNAWCAMAAADNGAGWASTWGNTRAEAEGKALTQCDNSYSSGSHLVVSVFSGDDDEEGFAIMAVSRDELTNFWKLYGDADLDQDTLATCYQSWEHATHDERNTQYTEFMDQIKEIEEAEKYVEIQISNPAKYGVAWSFVVNGQTQTLPSGTSVEYNRRCVVEFEPGGGATTASYTLTEGNYALTFADGRWDLVQQAVEPETTEPVTGEEWQMFDAMYDDADLDAATRKTLADSWEHATSAERKVQYDQFTAEVKEAVAAATPHEIRIVNPAANKVAWSYLIDGQPHTLAAGQSQELHAQVTISMDLGGTTGATQYTLTDGAYEFASDGDHWQFRQAASEDESTPQADAEPPTSAEQAMFSEMYDDAGLDADTLQTIKDAWNGMTAAQRKQQYEQFTAKVKSAVDAATPHEIRIVNPAANKVAWQYLLDDKLRTLKAGDVQVLHATATIKLNLGGSTGEIEQPLRDGTYTFTTSGDQWKLEYSSSDAVADAAQAEPVTAEEQKMFDEIYAQAGLDAAALKLVDDHWKNSTHAERAAQYKQFLANVDQATKPAEATPAADASAPTPVTADEQKMFDEMYGQLGLDADTLKTLQDAWSHATSAERKSQHEQFMAQIAAAEKTAAQAEAAPGKP